MSTTQMGASEPAVLIRALSDKLGEFPPEMARYLLNVDLNDKDKARMQELSLRNQSVVLSKAEQDELDALMNVGSMIAILQSKVRRMLKIKPESRVVS